ncbi:VOC family protein [Amycolatopsis sp. OK19-0408]|uniref:VOC family protein n=1 Tax=Amycolatopsis iheyensis TaxID=2945988 RepID=A0A9X2N9M6_9PSEU|nr:VOC family protein [Amycolatopsis iheyensis]MCR6483792.1 VOC family protein [Amycolatopsis iheyensis]
MACRITELVLDCHDPDRLAEFWCAVLGYEIIGPEPDGLALGPPGARFGEGPPTLILARTEHPRPGKLPLHLDVSPAGTDQDTELARLLALGARPKDVGQDDSESWEVLQDPEGNEFCLLRKDVGAA